MKLNEIYEMIKTIKAKQGQVEVPAHLLGVSGAAKVNQHLMKEDPRSSYQFSRRTNSYTFFNAEPGQQ